MAFPTFAAFATGEQSVDSTTHAITLPAGVTAGDLLIVLFTVDGAPTCTGAGWTKLGQAGDGTSAVTAAIFWKVATGSDALTVGTNLQQSTHTSMRITGADGVTGTSAGGSSTNGNPPSHTAPGAADILWVATWSGDGTVVPTAPPSGFTAFGSKTGTGLNTASSYPARMTSAVGVLDPGTFTNSSRPWVCWTLAVMPTPAAGRRVERKDAGGVWQPQVVEKKDAGGVWQPQILERQDTTGVWS